jgi:hypothetical protein
MLQLIIPARPATPDQEYFDEKTQEFFIVPGKPATKEYTLQLEHSLVSLSKWESKYCKSFLAHKDITEEETIEYIKCMTITQNVPPEAYENLTNENIEAVTNYINAPMTATWFSDNKRQGGRSSEVVTAELIYYWMIALNIPFECQKWHLNRLLTLVRVCNIKNTPPKKMGKRATLSRNAALNAARRQQLNTNG